MRTDTQLYPKLLGGRGLPHWLGPGDVEYIPLGSAAIHLLINATGPNGIM